MTPAELDARERIVNATLDLLDETKDVDQVTVRRIAERAAVGTGLINYHFQSRENLLIEAVGRVIGKAVAPYLDPARLQGLDPEDALKTLLKQGAHAAQAYANYAKIAIRSGLAQGSMDVPLMILPLLRRAVEKPVENAVGKPGERRVEKPVEEIRLRMAALQMIAASQMAFVSPQAFRMYTGMDIGQEMVCDEMIDLLVDLCVKSLR